ncbi:glycosyltransferase family 2 protein [Glaciecola sp. SC05]|uniref:glycosyltransferase family 2 protein n=1 Tax=Glaciecola sp. SC05 TaxID=1987355 RepID=UPI003528485A
MSIFLAGLFCLISFVSLFFTAQLLLGQISSKRCCSKKISREKAAIIIPAHNEEMGIEATLRGILTKTKADDLVVVVADNCNDKTAELARSMGVMVVERFNTSEVGKGHALQAGINHIEALGNEWPTIVVMDADCTFESDALDVLVSDSQSKQSVSQALYLMKSPNKQNVKLNISEFTWLIKNWIRPLGQKRMGISCHLQGSGMAFPKHIFAKYSLASSNIVEDLELGLNLVNGGEAILFNPAAVVISYFPENEEGLDIQRKRWEHGHFSIISRTPKVLLKAIMTMNYRLFMQALDAAIPPTVLWGVVLMATTLTAAIASIWISSIWFYILVLSVFALVVGLAISWFNFGREILSFRQLKGMPLFVLSKFSIYSSFFTNRQKKWVRTKRDD